MGETGNNIMMTTDEFCTTMNDNIGTQIQWFLEIRAQECIVDDY